MVKAIEERVLATSRLQIESTDPNLKRPLRRAVRHAAGLELMRDKLDSGFPLYIDVVFNHGINAECVYFNDKKIEGAKDNLVIWKANKDILNRREVSHSVASTLALMLTVLGYEVFLSGSEEPFDPLIQGRRDGSDAGD